MACGCQKSREQFQVVTNDGHGRTVFTSSSKDTAATVSKRYPGSVVKNTQTGTIVHTNPTEAGQ